ncbi:hypothetical protein NQ318_010384 [Aromia moschata]|uniref:Uncharacterized protein n=1 Tax=Aromia moschata TaxID=1265417 RepID=A0AAV8XV88_9CUCU|nr:hypothetical protein NQ318_010384 [Aromia moschata]
MLFSKYKPSSFQRFPPKFARCLIGCEKKFTDRGPPWVPKLHTSVILIAGLKLICGYLNVDIEWL